MYGLDDCIKEAEKYVDIPKAKVVILHRANGHLKHDKIKVIKVGNSIYSIAGLCFTHVIIDKSSSFFNFEIEYIKARLRSPNYTGEFVLKVV